MIYRIEYVGDGKGKRKFAHLVKNREELMALRNAPENLDNLAKARQGDHEAKMKLLQLAARASAAISSTMWTAMTATIRSVSENLLWSIRTR